MKKFLLAGLSSAALCGFVSALFVTAASASPPAYPPAGQCGISVGSSETTPGSALAVSGAGLAANRTYTLSSNGTAVGSARTNGSGGFSASVKLGSAGSQTLSIAGSHCPKTVVHVVGAVHVTRQAKTNHTKQATAQGTKAAAGSKSSTLASTGVRIAGLLTIGFALIGAGLMMASVRRRARS